MSVPRSVPVRDEWGAYYDRYGPGGQYDRPRRRRGYGNGEPEVPPRVYETSAAVGAYLSSGRRCFTAKCAAEAERGSDVCTDCRAERARRAAELFGAA